MERSFKNKKVNYLPLGQPRNDALSFYTKEEQLKKIKEEYPNLPNHEQANLYAPTWRSYDTVKFFPFADITAEELNNELKKSNTVLFYVNTLIFHRYLTNRV